MLVRVAVVGVVLASGAVSREIDEDDDASFLEQNEEVDEDEDAEEDETFEDEQEEDELEDEEEDASAFLEEEAEDEDEKNDEEDEDELEDEEDDEGKPASKLVKTVRTAMANGSNASALLEDEDDEAEIEEDEQDNEDEDEDEEKENEEDEQDDEDEGDDEEEGGRPHHHRHRRHRRKGVAPRKRIRKLAKAVAAAIGNHSHHPGQHGQAAGCKVTTYSAGHCHGKAVKTYATFAANGQQWKWGSGYQENQPVSAKIQGSCKKVEFYDEDNNKEGYSDNMIKKTTGCFDFTYDLKKDLGGLKVFAKVIKCSANQHVVAHVCQVCPAGTRNAAGDSASGKDTKCKAIKCGLNQHVKANACVSCPAGSKNSAGNDASGSDTKCKAPCKVTTYSAGHCHGKAVKTYATFAANGQQWKWGSGYQENQPVSAKIQGSCKKVEFYDEDHNHEGYSDNMIKKTTGCFDFTYDLKKDLGGLKVFAK